jgi:hypothetical protein
VAGDDEHEADGWAVLHDRSFLPQQGDYAPLYLVGPFPNKELADLILARLECPCRKTVIPVFFPMGMTMMLTIPLPDTDTDTEGPVH